MRTDLKSIGAAEERRAFTAYLRRLQRQGQLLASIESLIDWVLKRDERYNKAKGGLGRKAKA